MNRTLRVLFVEDSEPDLALLTRHLSRAGYELVSESVETRAAMRAALETREMDVILCDYSMPHFNATQALDLLKEMELDIPFIIVCGTAGEAVAVEAMRAGAHDYLMKDNLVRLAPTIERELHELENRRARRRAETTLEEAGYKVLQATNGGEALLICEEYPEPIHLLLTDVVMPGMNGRAVADRLQTLRPQTIILYMSGYTVDAIVHRGVLNEGVNFVEKPFAPAALARKVRALLDAERS